MLTAPAVVGFVDGGAEGDHFEALVLSAITAHSSPAWTTARWVLSGNT
jgi:hypothetical protein